MATGYLKRILNKIIQKESIRLPSKLYRSLLSPHNAIPTDKNIRIPLALKYYHYKEGNTEDVDHLFLRNDLEKAIWGHFINIFEVRSPRFFNFKSLFKEWAKEGRPESIERLFFTLTPILNFWEIWKERNRRRYEEGYKIDNNHQWSAIIIKVKY